MHQEKELIDALDGSRVRTPEPCLICRSTEAVLRRRYVRTELELFCDRCETWLGVRVTAADLQKRQPPTAPASLSLTSPPRWVNGG
jgi:hypothetical protein